ncbi:MAG: hypothetical protein HC896_09705 [Bacteroidales bacterium]|nr:hypothetical protein [Bacteroidales bacterium]
MVPAAGEHAIVSNGHNVALTGDATVGSVEIGTGAALSLGSHQFTLNIGGIVNNGTLNIGTSTINYAASGNQTVDVLNYYNVTVSGTGAKTLAGDITIQNNLLIYGLPASLSLVANNFDINLQGDWQSTATFVPGTGNVNITGTVNQLVENTNGVEIFYNLNIQNPLGVSMSSNVTITDTLKMNGGNINTSTYKIVIGTGAGNAGGIARNSGYVNGNLERWVVSNVPYVFPIQKNANVREVSMQFANVTTPGSIQIGFEEMAPGNNGLPMVEGSVNVTSTYAQGYWTVQEINNVNFAGGYNISLRAGGFSINPDVRVVSRPDATTDWLLNGTHAPAVGNLAYRNVVTIYPAIGPLHKPTVACLVPWLTLPP